ncbi:MAG: hypothetical protein WC373_12600 [Smithella sp.]|jgi:hypothetical protein
MKTIDQILEMFPDTKEADWRIENDAWIHSSCRISGGDFRGGVFRGGEFRDGIFHGGVFRGGVFRGGVFLGGVFHDGEFRGGMFLGGEFHDGEFRDGVLKLQIQGTKHFVNSPDGKNIRIGCEEHSVDFWLDNYTRIGKENGYSDDQISEYHDYILLFKQAIDRRA